MKPTRRPARILIVIVETLLIGWALMFLAEYFGWQVFREAGGTAVAFAALPSL